MKTVRLVEHHMFGTANSMSVNLMYRGRVIKYFTGYEGEHADLRKKALRWARNQGFTHYQLGEDTLKRNNLIKEDPE